MLQEELFVDDSPPVCLVQLSNKPHNLGRSEVRSSPEQDNIKSLQSSPELARALESSTCLTQTTCCITPRPDLSIANPISEDCEQTVANDNLQVDVTSGVIALSAGPPVATIFSNTLPSAPNAASLTKRDVLMAVSVAEDGAVNQVTSGTEDVDEDFDPEDRPLRVDLSSEFEATPLDASNLSHVKLDQQLFVGTAQNIIDYHSDLSLSTEAKSSHFQATVQKDSKSELEIQSHQQMSEAPVQDNETSISNASSTMPPFSEENPCSVISQNISTSGDPPVLVALSLPSAFSTTDTIGPAVSTSLLDIRPKPVISHASQSGTIAPSSSSSTMASTVQITSQAGVHLMPYVTNTVPVMPSPHTIQFPSLNAGASGIAMHNPANNHTGTAGLQILNMTPIPQFVGTPGIVLHSAGGPGFQPPTASLIPGMPTAPLGPGPPLNFLPSPHPAFSTTLIQPSGVDFLMDPSLGLTQYSPSNPLTMINPVNPGPQILDPLSGNSLSSIYPSFVHPPHAPTQAFFVTSSSVFIPPTYRPSFASGTNIVNATAPQMCTSLSTSGASLFPCSSLSLPNASAGAGPIYLHPSHTPIIPPSFGPTPTSIYAQQYPPFSLPTWQGTFEPCVSISPNYTSPGTATFKSPENTVTVQSSTVIPICPATPHSFSTVYSTSIPTDNPSTLPQPPVLQPCPLLSKKLPLPTSRCPGLPTLSSSRTVAQQTTVRHSLVSSAMTGLVPNNIQPVDRKLTRTVGIRPPNSNTLLPPLRRRRPVTHLKSKSQVSEDVSIVRNNSDGCTQSTTNDLSEVDPGPMADTIQSLPFAAQTPETSPVPIYQSSISQVACTKNYTPSVSSIPSTRNSKTASPVDQRQVGDMAECEILDTLMVRTEKGHNIANGSVDATDSPTKLIHRTSRSPSPGSFSSGCHSASSPVTKSKTNAESVAERSVCFLNGVEENAEFSSPVKRYSASRNPLPFDPKDEPIPSSSPLEATGLLPVCRKELGSPCFSTHSLPPPLLLVGPDAHRILTHYVDGHVIYESTKPFPVRNGMSVVEAALLQQCIKEEQGLSSFSPSPTGRVSHPTGTDAVVNGFEPVQRTTVNEQIKDPGLPEQQQMGRHAQSRVCSSALFNVDVPLETFNLRGNTVHPDAPAGLERFRPTSKAFVTHASSVSNVDSDSADSIGRDDHLSVCVGFRHCHRTSPMSSSVCNAVPLTNSAVGTASNTMHQSPVGFQFASHIVPQNPLPPPPGPVCTWTSDDVVEFVRGTPGCGAYAAAFLANEIDGEALLLLAQDQFIQPPIGMKIGPALKLVARLESIRHIV